MRPLKGHKRLYGWGENTPFAWKISWNNGRKEAQNEPLSLPQNVMLLLYGLPIYIFHTYLIEFAFLKIINGSHRRLPIQSLLVGYMNFLFPKQFVTIFNLD
jgi:hypothetical protein